jgi:ATP-binding cassette, subfamily C, bacterial LapB
MADLEMAQGAADLPEGGIADPWILALRHVAAHYRLPLSIQRATLAASWDLERDRQERLHNLARGLGLRLKFVAARDMGAALTSWRLPLIVERRDGDVAVVTAISADGEASLAASGDQGLEHVVSRVDLLADLACVAIPRPLKGIPDARIDAYIRPFEQGWFRRIILGDIRPYGHVLVAALVTNILGLAGIVFSQQVYDRVVPAESWPTLYVLFGGVLLTILFDYILRTLRSNVTDLLGKRADLRMSDEVFGHALRVRNRARPTSTGTFIAQLRDLDQVRELLTSTTVGAIVDLPFFCLFLVIYWYIGGILVLIPLAALVMLVVPALLCQRKLQEYARESMRESSLRNAMLVEAIQGIEDIKSLQAEQRFQQQWNHYNAVAGEAQLKLRTLTGRLMVWTGNVQNLVYASVVFFGAPMVMHGDVTTGTLVAASILGSRMMAPLAQLTQVMTRLQQARVSLNSLNQLMSMPVDHPDKESRIHLPVIGGNYVFKDAVFHYRDENAPVALAVHGLAIRAGEHVAVLGRNGAGKSTLLQALSGMMDPAAGLVAVENVEMRQIDPADVRRDISLLSQKARLFHGTLRDNLTLGAPHASDEEILRALVMAGADDFVRHLPSGLDYGVLEGGLGLSGGQVQGLLLARLLIRRPCVALLDEPTASMDESAERKFIAEFGAWSKGRTVVIATHRTRVLDLVDRIIVVEGGRIALDDRKDAALAILQGGQNAASARVA